jgi:hypothetical protein
MIRGMTKFAAVSAVLLMSVGCTRFLGDFTVITTKNVDMSKLDISPIVGAKEAVGKQGGFFDTPNIEEAVDVAATPTNSPGLSDAKLYLRTFIFYAECEARGMPVTPVRN